MKKTAKKIIGLILAIIMVILPINMFAADETYTITVPTFEHGQILASPNPAKAGDKITVTVIPDEGYQLGGTLQISGNASQMKKNGSNYSFTMPAQDVVITSTQKDFKPIQQTGEYSITVNSVGNGTAWADYQTSPAGTLILVTVEPENGYKLESIKMSGGIWDDLPIGPYGTDIYSFNMPNFDVVITAVFTVDSSNPPPTYYNVTVETDGNGTAKADPSSAIAETGITLSATPDEGYRFVGWESGDIEITDNKFTMPAKDVKVKAVFELIPPTYYNVTVETDGNGTAKADPSSATAETGITLSATPDEGYRFVGWESDEVTVVDNKFTMPAKDVKVKAVFELIPPTYYNVTVETDGNGTAKADPSSATAETEITLSATPDEGYRFVRWESGDIEITDNKFIMPAKDVKVKAVFELIPPTYYNVTVETDGNGTAEADPSSATAETEITLSATPDEGYRFVRWESGDIEITDNKFTMPAKDVKVKAVFELIPPTYYNVTVETDGNGTAKADPSSATAETEITLSATPDEGYRFVGWESDEVTVVNGKFQMPAKDVKVKAVFELIPPTYYNVTVETDGNGTAKADPSSATAETGITLSATPDEGYRFVRWESDEVTVVNGKFQMPAKDVKVKAVFELIPPTYYNVTVETDGNGTAKADPSSAEAETEISLSYEAAKGYVFDRWEIISGNVEISGDNFIMPGSDVTVKAIFKKKTPTSGIVAIGAEIAPIPKKDPEIVVIKQDTLSTENPSTGDSNPLLLGAIITAVVSAGYLVLKRKRAK